VLPRWTVTALAVSVRPRSTSSPVPDSRLPKCAVVYQSVVQGADGSPDSAAEAFCGLSPSEVPSGPNAAALTGVTWRTGGGAGEWLGLGAADALGLGLGLGGWLARADCGCTDGRPDAADVRLWAPVEETRR
jgi:hypothetical protein